MIGITIANDQSTGTWVTVMMPIATYPPITARSPCARLTTFMTPNISDSPQANSAYSPPVRMPWMIALTQAITAPRGVGGDGSPRAGGLGGSSPRGQHRQPEVGGLDLLRGD